MNSDISGIILAGGNSRRMGFPKAFLSLGGRRVIDMLLAILRTFFDEIFIVTNNKNNFKRFEGLRVIEDLIQGQGPLGGIYTGLKSISQDKAFFVACDMPFLHRGLIKRLIDASKGEYSVIVPYSHRGIEPLHAIYSKSMLTDLENSLSRKEFSLRGFLQHCNCKYVRAYRKELASFSNINTPKDLKEIFHGNRYIKNR